MSTSTRRAIVIVGSLIAVLLVLALAVPAVSRLLSSTEETTHELPAELTTLTLDGGVGDVTVRALAPGESPSAVATTRSGLISPDVGVEVSGGTAELSDDCDGGWWGNCSVSWEITVPAEAAVSINHDVGDLEASDLAGALVLTGDVGSITATGTLATDVEARTSVGDVTLEFTQTPGSVRAQSSTGDVTVSVPADDTAYRVTASTSVGSVDNSLGSDSSASSSIDARSSVGDVTLRRE